MILGIKLLIEQIVQEIYAAFFRFLACNIVKNDFGLGNVC